MNEDEAKTKWCPMARVAVLARDTRGSGWIGAGSANRANASAEISSHGAENPLNPDACRCIASACMAWRWGRKPNPAYNPQQGSMWPQPHPPVPMYVRDDATGFCGLAGAPS